jgi:hypothetical protein
MRKKLYHKLAHESTVVANDWRLRYDEKIRREQERLVQIRQEEEQKARRLQEIEEEKKIRGYDRMDRIYAMWKGLYDEDDEQHRRNLLSRPSSNLSETPQISSAVSQRPPDDSQTGIASGENFSLHDFVTKHDLSETNVESHISAIQHDGWIKYRSRAQEESRPVVVGSERPKRSHHEANDRRIAVAHETRIRSQPQPSKGNHESNDETKREKKDKRRASKKTPNQPERKENKSHDGDRRETTKGSAGGVASVGVTTPSPAPLSDIQHSYSSSALAPPAVPMAVSKKRCGCWSSELCFCQTLPSPPSLPSPRQQQHQSHPSHPLPDLDSKVDELYSEYDEELQTFWTKLTQQREQQHSHHQTTVKRTVKGRPKSVSMSRSEKSEQAPRVQLYGYGFEDFDSDDGERQGVSESERAREQGLSFHDFPSRPSASSSSSQAYRPRPRPRSASASSSSSRAKKKSDPQRTLSYEPSSTASHASHQTRPLSASQRHFHHEERSDPYNFQDD